MNYEDMRKALIEDSEKEIAEQLWQVEKIIPFSSLIPSEVTFLISSL